jgi:hypothetical protein
MKDPPAIPSMFAPIGTAERRLMEALRTVVTDQHRGLQVDLAGQPVAAEFLRWFLLEAVPGMEGPFARVRLNQAEVIGTLDLSGQKLAFTPSFTACVLHGGIDLTDAELRGFEVIGGELNHLWADRVTTTGSVLLRAGIDDPCYHHPQPLGATLTIHQRVLLSGAKVHGNLDLRGAVLAGHFQDDEEAVAVLADGLAVDGNFLLSEGASVHGEVRLNGCRIGRNLDCSGSSLENRGGFSLSVAGGHVEGTVYLRALDGRAFGSVGTVRFESARVDGVLDCSGGQFTATAFATPGWTRRRASAETGATPAVTRAHDNADELDALQANNLQTGAAVRLRDGFCVHGIVWLILACIGGDLDCTGGKFDFPGEEPLCADGAKIDGCTYLSKVHSSGLLGFVQATLQQGLACDQVVFDLSGVRRKWSIALPDSSVARELCEDLCGIYAAGASISGGLLLRGVRRLAAQNPGRGPAQAVRTLWLAAPGAKADLVDDDQESWSAPHRIDLRDCSYGLISNLTSEIGWRADRLDQEYAAFNAARGWGRRRLDWEVFWLTWRDSHRDGGALAGEAKRFSPGPYLQLARVVRRAGFETAADDVLLRLERNRTRYSGFEWPSLLWRHTIDGVLRYGFAPFRPLRFLVAWILVSTILFQYSRGEHWLVPTKDNPPLSSPDGARDHVSFVAPFYAIESTVPFMNLGQKAHFNTQPSWSLPGILNVVNMFLGYVLALFFGAALGGLVKGGQDDG